MWFSSNRPCLRTLELEGADPGIYRAAFKAISSPYFDPHCFRDALVQLGERIRTKPEQFYAWA